MKKVDIKSVEDIESVKAALINNEKIEIGDIAPIPLIIKLSGGRFDNCDPRYFDATAARIAVKTQESYDKLLNEIEKRWNIRVAKSQRTLKFHIEAGSTEIITEILKGVLEVVKTMESPYDFLALIALVAAFAGNIAYSKKIEKDKTEIEAAKQIKEKELEGAERTRYLETIDKAIAELADCQKSRRLAEAIDAPKRAALSLLDEGEFLSIGNGENRLTKASLKAYEYIEPIAEDIEEIINGEFAVDARDFRGEGKPFKLGGITRLANSALLDASKRIKLMELADRQIAANLKIKLIKDSNTKKIKEVYILDLLD